MKSLNQLINIIALFQSNKNIGKPCFKLKANKDNFKKSASKLEYITGVEANGKNGKYYIDITPGVHIK